MASRGVPAGAPSRQGAGLEARQELGIGGTSGSSSERVGVGTASARSGRP